jgi:hypothetical protein
MILHLYLCVLTPVTVSLGLSSSEQWQVLKCFVMQEYYGRINSLFEKLIGAVPAVLDKQQNSASYCKHN